MSWYIDRNLLLSQTVHESLFENNFTTNIQRSMEKERTNREPAVICNNWRFTKWNKTNEVHSMRTVNSFVFVEKPIGSDSPKGKAIVWLVKSHSFQKNYRLEKVTICKCMPTLSHSLTIMILILFRKNSNGSHGWYSKRRGYYNLRVVFHEDSLFYIFNTVINVNVYQIYYF